ncbi:hypothetical protein [Reyranella sp.]|uniref:hypothetical protein n=1 Tax=Reyranella sp. TaxID=1929291 RepID=UPI0037833FE4
MPTIGIRQMMDRQPAGNSALAAALTRLADAYASASEAHHRIMGDLTTTPAARTVRSARHAKATLGPAVEALQQARTLAAATRADLMKNAAKVFSYSDAADALLAGEIRRHFATLASPERLAAVRTAIEAKDATTLRAIGAGPAYLSGLPAEMHEHARAVLIEADPAAKGVPDALRSLGEQEAFAVLIEETVLQSMADLVDFVEADSLEQMAQAAVAA